MNVSNTQNTTSVCGFEKNVLFFLQSIIGAEQEYNLTQPARDGLQLKVMHAFPLFIANILISSIKYRFMSTFTLSQYINYISSNLSNIKDFMTWRKDISVGMSFNITSGNEFKLLCMHTFPYKL